MPMQVVNGAMLTCTFGAAPSSLVVLPQNRMMCSGMPAANILDYIPMTNIMPFGMCMSIANPEVASATASALGVLTPMPCVPATSAPWTPGSPTKSLAGPPSLNDTSMCMCMWAGVIQVSFAGQVQTQIP